jgi:hypothetical protein
MNGTRDVPLRSVMSGWGHSKMMVLSKKNYGSDNEID